MDVHDPRFRVAAARRILHDEGCDGGIGGQVSVRSTDNDGFWVSPFGFFEETLPQDVQKLSFTCELLPGGDQRREASPAVDFHAEVYVQRDDVHAIVHTHSVWASMLCATRAFIGTWNPDAVLLHDEQAAFEPGEHESAIDPKAIAAAIGDKRVLWMRHHGVIVAGTSLEQATILARDIELMAQFELQLRGADPIEMPAHRIPSSKASMERWHIEHLWSANMRRLRRTAPDLFDALIDHQMQGAGYL